MVVHTKWVLYCLKETVMKKLLVFASLTLSSGLALAKEPEPQERKITIINTTEKTLVGTVGPHSSSGKALSSAVKVTIDPLERHVVRFYEQSQTFNTDEIYLRIKGKKEKANSTIFEGIHHHHNYYVSESYFDKSGLRIRDFPPSRGHSRPPSPPPGASGMPLRPPTSDMPLPPRF